MPHRYRSALALCCGLLSLLLSVAPAAEFTSARVAVYFSPNGGATDAVVHEVNAATHQILVQAYATGQPLKVLPDAVAENTAQDWEQITDFSIAHFEEMKCILDAEDPSYAH